MFIKCDCNPGVSIAVPLVEPFQSQEFEQRCVERGGAFNLRNVATEIQNHNFRAGNLVGHHLSARERSQKILPAPHD